MIFVTVGAQMPFDRLVRTLDQWAEHTGRRDIFAQIGDTQWRPRHIRWTHFLDPPEFRSTVESADVVVAHAGMGSIITALELGKPILVMPRRGEFRETRNDHQCATAERLEAQGRILVAWDESELTEKLTQLEHLCPKERISPHADPRLIAAIRVFIDQGRIKGSAMEDALAPNAVMPQVVQASE